MCRAVSCPHVSAHNESFASCSPQAKFLTSSSQNPTLASSHALEIDPARHLGSPDLKIGLPGRPTRFDTEWHAMRLRGVRFKPEAGYQRSGSGIQLTFDVHRLDEVGRPGGYLGRYALNIPYGGTPSSLDDPSKSLLMHLGLDIGEVQAGRGDHGPEARWLQGRIGPPDPASLDYQRLDEIRPMENQTSAEDAGAPTQESACPMTRPNVTLWAETNLPAPAAPPTDEAEAVVNPPIPARGSLATHAVASSTPALKVVALGQNGPDKVHAARLIGTETGAFREVHSKLGRGQLFFLYLLLTSTRVESRDGAEWTLVPESDAEEAFKTWVQKKLLKFGRDKQRSVKVRLTKNWYRFKQQFSRVDELKDLFRTFPDGLGGSQKCFAIKLPPGQAKMEMPISDLIQSHW